MKKYFTILLISCFAIGTSAQILTLSGDTMSARDFADTTIDANGTIVNHTSQNLSVRWNRTLEDIPRGWSTQVCDAQLCSLPEVSSRVFQLGANAMGTFHVTFVPDNISGVGVVDLEAYVEGPDSAASYVKGTYIAVADPVTGIETHFSPANSDIKIYPNPVKDYILVKDLPQYQASTVEVYNIFGKKMLSFHNPVGINSTTVQRYNMESLPKGIYMIRVYDSFMNVLHTKSISKIN